MVVRAVGKDLAVMKRLVSLRMLESAMNNRNIAAEVIDVVRDRLDISDRVSSLGSRQSYACCLSGEMKACVGNASGGD